MLAPDPITQFARAFASFVQELTQPSAATPIASRLSDREFQIFELLGKGRSTQEIAKQLRIRPNTAGAHIFNLRAKLGKSTSADLRRAAVEYRASHP